MLCYAMLCYAMLCYVMLCYVMLCYVMLCYVMNGSDIKVKVRNRDSCQDITICIKVRIIITYMLCAWISA